MKTLYRGSIFETNSSATHSMVIMSQSDYEKWEKNGLYVCEGDCDKLYTFDEAIEKVNDNHYLDKYIEIGDTNKIKRALNNSGYFTCDDWFNNDFLEADSCDYKTKSGDEIVIAYRYGYDG